MGARHSTEVERCNIVSSVKYDVETRNRVGANKLMSDDDGWLHIQNIRDASVF